MEQEFEIEREYFREEIDSLQRKIEIQNADKESGVKSPNQWKAFQPV